MRVGNGLGNVASSAAIRVRNGATGIFAKFSAISARRRGEPADSFSDATRGYGFAQFRIILGPRTAVANGATDGVSLAVIIVRNCPAWGAGRLQMIPAGNRGHFADAAGIGTPFLNANPGWRSAQFRIISGPMG